MTRYARSWRRLPVAEWPKADVEAWNLALAPASLLAPSLGRASRWAVGGVRSAEQGFGLFLGYLAAKYDLGADTPIRERVTFERVTAYLNELNKLEYAPYTIAARLQQLGDTLSVLDPDGDWLWIRRAAGRVRGRARPVTDVESRLRSPEEVEGLGIELMTAADQEYANDPRRAALLFRDGLAIATLVHRPLRIGNFTSISIDNHLHRDGPLWRIEFPAHEMKNRRPYACLWPETLTASLDRYVSLYRPLLIKNGTGCSETQALWLTVNGGPIGSAALTFRVCMHTKAKFGIAINPHAFRGSAATTIATDDPKNVTGVAAVLGHSSTETAERHYIRAKSVDASVRYQASLQQLLQQNRAGEHPGLV